VQIFNPKLSNVQPENVISRIDWWRLFNIFLVPGWSFHHLLICQILGISNRPFALMAQTTHLHSLSARNQPMIQPAKYRCIHLFSCLHDGGRQSSRSAAGRPKTCSESRNLQKVIGSSSSNPQTSRPDEQEQEQERKTLPPKPSQASPRGTSTLSEYIVNISERNNKPQIYLGPKAVFPFLTVAHDKAFAPLCRLNLQRGRSSQSSKHK
jgi:hypothetical protein